MNLKKIRFFLSVPLLLMSLELGEVVFGERKRGGDGGISCSLFNTASSCTLISNRPLHNFKNFKRMLYGADILKAFVVVVSGSSGMRCK